MHLGIGPDFSRRNTEHRPYQVPGCKFPRRGNSGDAGQATAAQQVEQQGFCLVMLVVSADQPVVLLHQAAEYCIARFACCGFRAALRTAADVSLPRQVFDAVALCYSSTLRVPGTRVRMQAMVDVCCQQGSLANCPVRGHRVQQHRRVEATAEGNDEAAWLASD